MSKTTDKHRKEAEKHATRVHEQNLAKKKLEAETRQRAAAEKLHLWKEQILPRWNDIKGSKQVGDLCTKGIPPGIRGKVWPLLIGNALKVLLDLVLFPFFASFQALDIIY